jgi:hypothetical protein
MQKHVRGNRDSAKACWKGCRPVSSIYETRTMWNCKGNLTDLKRILHLSLAKGNPSKYINQVELIHNTCLAKGNPKRTL